MALALGAPLAVGGAAHAAIVPVALPQGITVFPMRDFLGAEGFDGPIRIEVWRDGVKVGSASGTPGPDAETGTFLEVNHPGGVCWSGSTPDIIAGDEVRVVTDDSDPADPVGQSTVVQDVSAEQARSVDLDGDGRANDIVITGRAVHASGAGPISADLLEARIVAPEMRDADEAWRRDLRAAAGVPVPGAGTAFTPDSSGSFSYDAAGPGNEDGTHWTAVFKNVPDHIRPLAVAGETRIMSWERTNGNDDRIGLTIYEAGLVGGPGMPECPAGSTQGVSGTVPANVNIAARGAADLVVSGTAVNAASATVTVDDTDGSSSDAITVPATVGTPASTAETSAPVAPIARQTFRAAVPMSEVLADGRLSDGDLVVSATFQRVVETVEERPTETGTATVYVHGTVPMGGSQLTVLKDLVAPAAPSISPPGGIYYGPQSVTLNQEDELQETVRYRIAASATPDPTAASTIATGQISVTASQQLKAASFDRAGNRSAVSTATYDVRTATAPPAPTGLTATAGDRRVTLGWVAPATDGGSPITDYVVEVFQGSVLQSALTQRTGDGAATSWTVAGLTNGTPYQFRVRAQNSLGTGQPTSPFVTATPVAADAVQPTLTTRSPLAGATGVARTATVTGTFSEPVTGVSSTNVTLRQGTTATGALVAATVTYDAATRRMVLDPTADLAGSTQYTVRLAGVRDPAGNALAAASASWSFTTAAAADTTAPALTTRTPAAGATGQARDVSPTATFSEPVTGVSGTTATLRQGTTATGTLVTAAVRYNATTRTMTLDPGANLAAGTQYTVRLSSGIRDAAGNALPAVSWTFTTATDGTAPTVTARTPAVNATGSSRTGNITATFSEAVRTPAAGQVTLRVGTATTGTLVASAVTYDAAARRVTLNPNVTLAASTQYTVRLTGILDTAGNALAPVTWSFRTGA